MSYLRARQGSRALLPGAYVTISLVVVVLTGTVSCLLGQAHPPRPLPSPAGRLAEYSHCLSHITQGVIGRFL